MAIFRGTGGSGSSSDSTIVDAVTAQATIATTKRDEAEGFRDEAEGFKNTASTAATTATTKATEANASATTAEGNKDLCVSLRNETLGLANDALASANAAEASATTANSSAVQTVAGSNTQVVGVYNNIANVNTVAGVNTDVTTVAGISSDVTTVAADASDIGTVSTNIANVNNVGNNIANVNAVHGNASNINTVAADGTDIGTVATNIANVNTVAGISSTVTTVAGLESKMDTVIADASDIGAVAGNIGDVTTVAGINSDVDTVAGIAAKVTTVADNITDVQNADTNATNAASSASNASASATSASNSATTATTKATEASNSATAASNSATTATTKASQAAGSATTAGTSASTATTKASEASASATTATTKASEAASSASAASGSATTAVTKASEASVSAASAATSATNSSNAASTWNNFYNSYLGVADAPPSVDVLGNAIVAGALYYDTGAGSNTVGLYVYNGSSWVYSTNYNNVTAPYSLSQDLATNGNDISFGDNAKAQFGASNDLQIYHDGVSRIKEVGANGLYVDVTNDMYIRRGDTSAVMAEFNAGVAKLMFDGSQKLATTATGIDVTGTATMDGLTVDGAGYAYLGNTAAYRGELNYDDSGNTALTIANSWNNDNSEINFKVKTAGTGKQALQIKGSGDISFYEDTGTTPKFFWDASAESLGIGTSSPSGALHVAGKSTGRNTIVSNVTLDGGSTVANPYDGFGFGINFTGKDYGNAVRDYAYIYSVMEAAGSPTGGGDAGFTAGLRFYTNGGGASGATPTERLRIDSSGNVIVNNNGSGNGVIKVNGASGNSQNLIFQRGGTEASRIGHSNSADLAFYTGSGVSERMRITSSGNVGIGTSSPNEPLTVSGNTLTYGSTGNVGSGVSLFLGNNSNSRDIALTRVASGSLGIGRYSGGWQETARFDSSGNVGIGTTSPSRNLSVNGTFGVGNGTIETLISFSDRGIFGTQSNHDLEIRTNGSERMRIDSSGNLLVGKTSANSLAEGFEVRASGLTLMTKDGGSAANFKRKTSDGNIVVFEKDSATVGSISVTSSATSYNTSSDERLKENIQDAQDAGSKIDAIQIRQFDWKSDGSHQDYGVIAQELLEVAPEAVSEGETEDDMMSVDYSKLVPTLIKEIQTLRNRVAQLENN